MKTNLKITNFDLTPTLRAQLNKKIAELDKYFNNIQLLEAEVGRKSLKHQKGEIYFCELQVTVPGKLLRYCQESETMVKAINLAKKGLQMEIKKYKEKQSKA